MVALIGLTSLFGQASSLLLKLCPNIYNLRLYDETDTSTADDIRVINTPCKVEAYQGKTKLNDAIKGSDIVLIGDDILSTPQTCFDVMAPKMQEYAKAIAESSPNALIIVAASPINKLVPVLSELLKENGYYDCNRVMGTTASFNIRANCILASYVNTDPRTVFLPVVGGDSEDTIVPLFSQAKPHFNISEAVMKRLIEDIKHASPLIYETKGSTEALNKAHATVKFLNSVIAGLRGEPNIMNIAFTKTTQVDGTEYFALPVLLGRFGIQARYGIPRILPFENDLIRESVFSLQKDAEFAKLFCKTRETAAETCNRNVAIRFRKSKEFEQFVNGLKKNKKGSITEDKIVNKIKPPIPVETGQSEEKLFNPGAFCLRHKNENFAKNGTIPTYMRTGESIMPVSLCYTFGNDNGIAKFLPKSSTAETPICEPTVCPDKPKEREISFTNIVSLIENLVKKTTEKMVNEKEKDESLKENFKNIEYLKGTSEKGKNFKVSIDKVENLNECLRKIDTLQLKSENPGNFDSSSKKVSGKTKYHGINWSNQPGVIKNKSLPIKNSITGESSYLPIGKTNESKKGDDKKNPLKRKYQEKTLESIFRPTLSALKERIDYKSGIRKPDLHNEFQLPETKQRSSVMNNEKHIDLKPQNIHVNSKKKSENTTAKHDRNKSVQKLFNFKSNSKSSQYWNRTGHANNSPVSGENKNILNQSEHTKIQDKQKDIEKSQNISIPESNVYKQILLNSSNDSENNVIDNDNKQYDTINSSGNVDREHLQAGPEYKIEYYHKTDTLVNKKNEKLTDSITELENKNFLQDRYKTVFEKRNSIFVKTKGENDPSITMKDVKNMKKVLIGNLNSSMKKENIFYDKINKKAYELLVEKNSERKNNRNIGNFKNLFNDKSCKDSKDFVKNKLRSKYIINKSAKGETESISQSKKNKHIKKNSESKSYKDVKSVCYNAFANEVTQINNMDVRCDMEVMPSSNNRLRDQNNIIVKNSTVPDSKDIKSIQEQNDHKKQIDISFQENQSSLNDNKDLNMLMKTLDCDVFKYEEKVNINDVNNNDVVKQENPANNLNILIEQKPIINVTPSNQEEVTEDCDKLMKCEIKEKLSPDLESSQSSHQSENPESTEMSFEDVIKEIKLAMQPSNQPNKSIDISKQNGDEKSISNVKDKSEIKNVTENLEDETNEESHYFSQSEGFLKKETPVSDKNRTNQEKAESFKNQIDLKNLKISKVNSVLKNISKSSDKSRKHLKKSFPQTKVSCSTNNPDYISEVSSTTPEMFSYVKSRESRSNKKTSTHEAYSVSYIKSLRSCLKSKEHNKQDRKNARQEGLKVSIKNLNDFEVPVKSIKQKTNSSKIKKPIKLNKPSTPLSKYSKSFITSKYNSLVSKKKNVSEAQGFFSGHLGQKVDEINKTEHSFSLRDKNGINNYFLLKGLLPKIKSNKHNLDSQNGSFSLLKTNVCNEDPFMSIKDKQKSIIDPAKGNLLKPDSNTKKNYTSNDSCSESGSLLITHNSVFSPNCPVHGFKHFLNAKNDQNKSSSPSNKGNMSKINEAMLSNLCRMCNKAGSGEKNQKTHNFKLYSTSALPMKKKSPSSLCVEKRKPVKHVLMSKNEGTEAKLPKGFIKKQRIIKILEKDLKNVIPQKSSNRTAETHTKERKGYKSKQAHNIMENTTNQKNSHLHQQVMSKPTKIDENVFYSGFDSSYIARYLRLPPKHIPHQQFFHSKDYQKYINSPKGRRVVDIFKINWSDSKNNKQKTKPSSVSVENDILVRGTCLDHVRNNFTSNKFAKRELSNTAYCDEKLTVVNSMEPSSLTNAFGQYTKEFVKCEYPRDEKLPSIRQLHKYAFR